jgi:hypothetical protein
LAAIVSNRADNAPVIVASVTGTEPDRQVRSAQVRRLEQAGIVVAPSNAQACELVLAIATNDIKVSRYANT